ESRMKRLAGAEAVKDEEVKAATATVNGLQAALDVDKAKLDEALLVDPYLDVRLAEADVDAKQAQVERAQLAVDECILKAPGAGTILRSSVHAGDVFGPQSQQPAFKFCPKGPQIIRAEIEQEYASRIAVGQAAIIEDDTTAGPVWKGKVTSIA